MNCKDCDQPIVRKSAELCEKHYRKRLRDTNPNYSQDNALRSREWRANNQKRVKELDKTRSEKRKEDLQYKEKAKYAAIKRNYNLTKEKYDEMIENGCVLCGSHNRLHVDHCHEKNVVRGILCHSCNIGIGFLERPDMWETKAQIYLFKSKVIYNTENIKNGTPENCYKV